MEFNKLVFAGLAVGCLAAAAGGSYLAVRQNQAASQVRRVQQCRRVIVTRCSTDAPGAPAAPGGPVTESEGVIAPEPATPVATRLRPLRLRRYVERPAMSPARRPAHHALRLATASRSTRTRRSLSAGA